jgi:predicted N-acetyltransferase YhbS
MNVTIRKMSIRDYEEVVALWTSIPGLGVHLADADSRDSIKSYLVRNPELSFVALSRGRLIGTVLCGHDGRRGVGAQRRPPMSHFASEARPASDRVQNVGGLPPKYRLQGVGRKLVNRCLKALAKVGIDKCYIFVFF